MVFAPPSLRVGSGSGLVLDFVSNSCGIFVLFSVFLVLVCVGLRSGEMEEQRRRRRGSKTGRQKSGPGVCFLTQWEIFKSFYTINKKFHGLQTVSARKSKKVVVCVRPRPSFNFFSLHVSVRTCPIRILCMHFRRNLLQFSLSTRQNSKFERIWTIFDGFWVIFIDFRWILEHFSLVFAWF